MTHARARTDTGQIAADLLLDIERIRAHILDTGDETLKDALAGVETFAAIALRVMAKTNPSKVRDIAMTVEIQNRMNPGVKR